MNPAVNDTTLSSTILDVVKMVLPFTASGAAMPADVAQDVVIKLSATQKLASLIEREIAIHRFAEARSPGDPALACEVEAAVEQAVISTVISVDFTRGPKK